MSIQRKKLTTEQIKLSALEVGQALRGKYVGCGPREITDRETGELKTVIQHSWERVDENLKGTGHRYSFIEDRGYAMAHADAMVKEGNVVEIVKLEPKKLQVGQVNQYDIFALS